MKVNISQSILCVFAALLIAATMGCGKKEEASINGADVVEPGLEEQVTEDQQVAVEEETSQIQEITTDVVVSVDGTVLTKSDLAVRVKNKMNPYRDVIPAGKMKELEKGVRSQLVEDFVVKTILQNEADRKKIT
ncbi:MAG TPA: hypothetical protein PKY71_11675, partial [Smithellaceae bacterium]|nr:hypothetical protein [Smithellaceae bacterium]